MNIIQHRTNLMKHWQIGRQIVLLHEHGYAERSDKAVENEVEHCNLGCN